MNELLRRMLFLPQQGSSFSQSVDHLHYFVIITTMIISTAVGMTALFFFIRYRRQHDEQTTPRITPTFRTEALFVGIPLFFFLLWFFMGFRDFVNLQTPPKDAMDIYVMGKQWMWKFSYPEGPNSLSALRVPAGRPIRLLLTSRDVIHSFFVPAFRIKQDALPGRYTQTWFQAIRPGSYEIFCAEYCGTGHSTMRAEVIVLKPDEYDAWIADQRRGLVARIDAETSERPQELNTSMVQQGQRMAITFGCFKCHSVDGSPHIGPTWLDLYRRREKLETGETIVADEGYLTESMMDPLAKVVAGFKPVMPSFRGKFSGAEAAALVEFIKSLRSDRVEKVSTRGPVYEPR